MKLLSDMLRELARAEVAEFAVASERLPCVKIGEAYEPVDDVARSTEAILEMLVASGGSRYVEDLEARPAQWTTHIEGVGVVGIAAVMRAGRVQARFTVVRRSTLPPPLEGRPSGRRSMRPGAGARPASRPPPKRTASQAAMRSLTPTANLRARRSPDLEGRGTGARAPTPDPLLSAALVSPGLMRSAPEVVATPLSPLDERLVAARAAGASDMHLVSGRPMLLRVAGDLEPTGEAIDEAAVEGMLLPVLPDHVQGAFAEHGSCDFALERASGRYRINVARQRTGLKACFRLIAAEVPTLASLGLPPEIERATHHHQGLVLVTGPTGHGKTSTLAAIVDIINAGTTHHVITVEDPVEYVHPRKKAMISQRQVGAHTRSFQSALKASLREDPDVIVVGELRDTDTVRMALAASETGHLVIGTMNTPNAAKTIDRLVDLFPPADQQQVRMTLAGGLHLVLSQRLLPAADGAGMVAAVELLPGSIALWSMIRDAKTYQIPSLQQRGKGAGIVRLDDSLADLVRSGRVTRAAAMAVAEAPDELDAVLSGKRAGVAGAPGAPASPPQPRADAGGGGLLGKAGQLFKSGRGS